MWEFSNEESFHGGICNIWTVMKPVVEKWQSNQTRQLMTTLADPKKSCGLASVWLSWKTADCNFNHSSNSQLSPHYIHSSLALVSHRHLCVKFLPAAFHTSWAKRLIPVSWPFAHQCFKYNFVINKIFNKKGPLMATDLPPQELTQNKIMVIWQRNLKKNC